MSRALGLLLGLPGWGRGNVSYQTQVKNIFGASLIGYWPLDDQSGTTARDVSGYGHNGAYSNITLGQDGIGDGSASASFNGTNSYVNLFSAGLASVFSGIEGTLSLWVKVNAIDRWEAETTARRIAVLTGDATNNIYVRRASLNSLFFGYLSNNSLSDVSVSDINPTDWMHIALVWSQSGDFVRSYINGKQVVSEKASVADWSAAALTGVSLGRDVYYWWGNMAHCALGNIALTAEQISGLAYNKWGGFRGVCIMFDDADASVYSGFDYMRDRGLNGTCYAITDLTDTAGYLTSEQLIEMDGDGWLIGNHTTADVVLTGLDLAGQTANIGGAITALDGWGLTRGSLHLAYPGGADNADTITAMANLGILTGRDTTTALVVDPFSIRHQKIPLSITIASTVTLEQVQTAVNRARSSGGYCTILFHRLTPGAASGNQWTTINFNALVDWFVSDGIPCKTIEDMYVEMI